MLGMMMNAPLTISSILRHAEAYHGQTEVVSRTVEGPIHRYTYSAMARRSRQLAKALDRIGLKFGDRVGTLAWNGYRHLELYFGVSGSGRVCHTINPRLFPEQIRYIIEHANDRVIFADLTFLPILEELADVVSKLDAIVLMTDSAHMPRSEKLPQLQCYETLLEQEDDALEWPVFDENTASGMCYTSGTTGNPKGVLYSHRSTVLHVMGVALPDGFGASAADTVAPVVPMFHVNAWGLPMLAPMTGARLVLPGPKLDGESLYSLFEEERVTLTAGVPTVWMNLLDWMRKHGQRLSHMKTVVIGGSAAASDMITQFNDMGILAKQGWGMTEVSPIGLMCTLLPKHAELPADQRIKMLAKQGRPLFGVEFRIKGQDGQDIPRDGVSFGAMLVRGPWVAARYYGLEDSSAHADAGWFDTGDVVTMDGDGYVQVVDRTKDVVKSGGEWISSIELENIAQGHPAIQEAAVTAKADPRWGERPVLVVQLRPQATFSHEDMQRLYKDKVSKWSMPDDLIVVESLPHTATGKLLKSEIRKFVAEHYANSRPD